MADKKILVVDYDAGSLEELSNLLKSHNFNVIKAADGQTAYNKFVAEKPDLVVLEAMLPKIHGFDLTKKIVQESGGRVPVIIVTGVYKGPQYKQEALSSLGAAAFFEKPVDVDELVGTVNKALREDDDFDEELPDPNSVIEALNRRGRGTPPAPAEHKTAQKGKRP